MSAWPRSSPAYTVYRTYVSPGTTPSERDVATVHAGRSDTAGIRCPDIDGELLAFLRDVLLLEVTGPGRNGNGAEVPAGHWPGNGQGGRGHCLLSLYAVCCPSTRWAATRAPWHSD